MFKLFKSSKMTNNHAKCTISMTNNHAKCTISMTNKPYLWATNKQYFQRMRYFTKIKKQNTKPVP